MLTKDDLAELNSWFDAYIEMVRDEFEKYAVGTREDANELRDQAIKTHKKVNHMVNYMDDRLEQLKGDIAEAKIFGLPSLVKSLEERLDELQCLRDGKFEYGRVSP